MGGAGSTIPESEYVPNPISAILLFLIYTHTHKHTQTHPRTSTYTHKKTHTCTSTCTQTHKVPGNDPERRRGGGQRGLKYKCCLSHRLVPVVAHRQRTPQAHTHTRTHTDTCTASVTIWSQPPKMCVSSPEPAGSARKWTLPRLVVTESVECSTLVRHSLALKCRHDTLLRR